MSSRLVEPSDYAAFARRIIRSLSGRVVAADPESLTLFVQLRAELAAAEDRALIGLRAEGYTLAELARPLGVTKQAMFQRMNVAVARVLEAS